MAPTLLFRFRAIAVYKRGVFIVIFKENTKTRYAAMALLPPFIIVWKQKSLTDQEMYNHEAIHHRQMLEMLIIPFLFWYGFEYFIGRIKGLNHHSAYRNISFEKEAYAFEKEQDYLLTRKWLSFTKFLK